jgi:hypothetical protein
VQALTNFLQKKKTNLKKERPSNIFLNVWSKFVFFDKGDSKYAEQYGKQLMLRTK